MGHRDTGTDIWTWGTAMGQKRGHGAWGMEKRVWGMGMAMGMAWIIGGMGVQQGTGHGYGVRGAGYVHEVLSKGIASPTPLPPAPHGARSTLRDKGPGSHSSIPPPSLCSWPPGDPPSPCTPRTLPWSQRGLSGSESLLLVLLPPLSERGLPREGDPTSEGGGVSISITSAFTTSMGASALAPPLLQEATRSLRDSAGSEAGLRRAGGGTQKDPGQHLPAPWHSLLFCTAILRLRFSCFSFWLLCCR